MEIKIAETPAEREAVYRLRYEVYVREKGIQCQDADHTRGWVRDYLDEKGILLIATRNGDVAGTIRLNLAKDGPLEFEEQYGARYFATYYPEHVSTTTKFIIHPRCRKSTVAVALAKHLFKLAKELRVVFDFINVDDDLVPFYRKMGYRLYGPRFDHPEFGNVPAMILLLDDLRYLDSVGCPMRQIAMENPVRPESVGYYDRLAKDQGWHNGTP